MSRYTCRTTRVAADFLDFIAFCRCSSGVAPHPLKILVSHLSPPPPFPGGVAPKFGSEKVSRYGVYGFVAGTDAGVALHCATELQSVLSKTTFLEASEIGVGLVGASFFKGNDRESPKKGGGGTYRRWGVQKRFWGGVLRRIYGMCSTPPEFSTPLCCSLKSWSHFLSLQPEETSHRHTHTHVCVLAAGFQEGPSCLARLSPRARHD